MPHDGPAEIQNDKSLCRRCNKLATQNRELELYGFSGDCEDCRKNPDLAWVTQAASAGLTQLAETIRTGILSAERGTIRVSTSWHRSPVARNRSNSHDLRYIGDGTTQLTPLCI